MAVVKQKDKKNVTSNFGKKSVTQEKSDNSSSGSFKLSQKHKLTEVITESGDYYAKIGEYKETSKGDLVFLHPFIIEDGKRYPFDLIMLNIKATNSRRSAEGQFLELFGDLDWNEVEGQYIRIGVHVNQKDGKTYVNVASVEEVEDGEIPEPPKKSRYNSERIKGILEDEEVGDEDAEDTDDEDEEDLFDEEEE